MQPYIFFSLFLKIATIASAMMFRASVFLTISLSSEPETECVQELCKASNLYGIDVWCVSENVRESSDGPRDQCLEQYTEYNLETGKTLRT